MNNIDILFNGILLDLSDTDDIYILLKSNIKLVMYINKYKLKTKIIDKFTIKKTDKFNNQYWYFNEKLHRENDLPAIIYHNTQEWWYYGKRHRENDLPALIFESGTKYWYYNDKLHRENDLPAYICFNGDQKWYSNGILYRENKG